MKVDLRSVRLALATRAANVSRLMFVGCLLVGMLSVSRAQTLNKVSVSPATVRGGSSSTGTVTLTSSAGTGGIVVALKSSNKSAVVPPSVTVSSGSSTALFAITTSPVSVDTTATIKGVVASSSASSNLTIKPPDLVSLSVNPTTLTGGTQTTGTVKISNPAPSGGLKVLLNSNSSSAAIPTTVTVAQGAISGTFGITTRNVTQATTVTLKASLASISKTATLTLSPVSIVGVTLNPSTVVGGSSTTGVVSLSGTALGQTTVRLNSDSPSATVPNTVIVPAGATSASFQVATTAVSNATTANVSATLGPVSRSATLSINTPDPILSLTSSAALMGGGSTSATVTLVSPAGPGGVVVSLSSSDKSANVPATVTIGAGQSTAQFVISTSVVSRPTAVTVTASSGASNQSIKFNVDPLFQLEVTPGEILGGNTVTGTVTLAEPAPAGGLTFTLSTENYNVPILVPASVTIPAGAKSASFSVGTGTPTWDGASAWVQAANSDGLYQYTFITVDTELKMTGIVLSPNSVSGGASTTVKVTMNEIAPRGGYVVNLFSNVPTLAKIPATLTIPAGAYSATATITTSPVSSFESSIISATVNGSTIATPLWVTKALPGTTYVLLNPPSWDTSQLGALTSNSQGGSVKLLNNNGDLALQHAAFWSGSKSSFIDLHPSSWNGSFVTGVSGNLQVGNVYSILGSGHAALWNGTASSFVDLNPTGADTSTANAISGMTVVGNSGVGNYTHATLWAGSATNVVDLSPHGSYGSSATATDGKSTVGYLGAGYIIASSAALWTNQSAASFVNLSPYGWSGSAALGVSGNNQVGWVGNLVWSTGGGMPYATIYGPYAARWSGTSSSYVSLDVPGDIWSSANAISGDIAVGYVQCSWPYGRHAALWLDTASTFIDLVALAGASWTNSSANAIYTDSTGIYVGGYCDQGAIVWHIPSSDLPKLRATRLQDSRSPRLP